MARPGATQCARCKGVYTYDQLYEAKMVARKRAVLLCSPCALRLTRLGLVR